MSENFKSKLPASFTRVVTDSCGIHGEQWLRDLPRIIGEIESNWALRAKTHFPNLSYNYVALCVLENGNEAVLKIALPLSNPEIQNEAEFLKKTNGKGAVKLLRYDEHRRAMLLEKLSPGANLKELHRNDPAKSVEIAVYTIRKLLIEAPEKSCFQSLENWFANFQKALNTKFPAAYIDKTLKFYEELTLNSKRKYLLHGDLHHENILSASREPFLTIDPKGVVGDLGYEISVFLNNHALWLASDANLREKLNYAVESFSESFDIEPANLRKWAYAQMILSAWWTFEENGKNWERDLAAAEIWKV